MNKIGKLIDAMQWLREHKQKLNEQIKEINKEIEQLEQIMINKMNEEGIEKASGHLATASKKVDIYPSVKSTEDFYKWIVENGRFEFAQARVNAAPVREMYQNENTLPPGVEVFTKEKILLRKKS